MNKKLLLISTLVASLSAGAAMASPGDDCRRGYGKGFGKGGMMGGHFNPEEMLARELNKDQVRTLMEARLIMKGNENLKVGKISSSDSGFDVTIVTQDDSLVKELQLAKNGMPKDKYEHMLKRLEKRRAYYDDKD